MDGELNPLVRDDVGTIDAVAREHTGAPTPPADRTVARRPKTVRWFLMRPLEKAGEHDHEVDEVAWLERGEALRRLRYDSDRRLVEALG